VLQAVAQRKNNSGSRRACLMLPLPCRASAGSGTAGKSLSVERAHSPVKAAVHWVQPPDHSHVPARGQIRWQVQAADARAVQR
jgi:hypothetical protein